RPMERQLPSLFPPWIAVGFAFDAVEQAMVASLPQLPFVFPPDRLGHLLLKPKHVAVSKIGILPTRAPRHSPPFLDRFPRGERRFEPDPRAVESCLVRPMNGRHRVAQRIRGRRD